MATPAAAAHRPAWTGSITFGLVAVPVRLYPATETHFGPVLHQYHRADGGRVRNRRFCEAEDREVGLEEIARGWEAPDGGMVVLTEEDEASLPVPSKRIIDVLAFVPADQVDPLRFDSPYYVGLGEKAPAKPYILLRDVMKDSGLVAVTKVTMRSRESMAVLRVLDDLLVLQTIRWADEVRPTAGIRSPGPDEVVHRQEIQMAQQLMASMSEGYELDEEKDAWVAALEELLMAKAGGGEVHRGPEPALGAEPTVDLMAALRASIAESQGKRAPEPPVRPAKKATAKKAPAKKTVAKRSAPKRAS
jgi:DNA end-binding protein Ku